MARPLTVRLAHGASGSAAAMRPWTDGLTKRGFAAEPVQLPRGSAERAIPVYRRRATQRDDGDRWTVVGGRVASLLAAEETPAGLVLLCYPLHRPGHPETVAERTAHWPHVSCPVLLLSGERDPFARIELLRTAVGLLGMPSCSLSGHRSWPELGSRRCAGSDRGLAGTSSRLQAADQAEALADDQGVVVQRPVGIAQVGADVLDVEPKNRSWAARHCATVRSPRPRRSRRPGRRRPCAAP